MKMLLESLFLVYKIPYMVISDQGELIDYSTKYEKRTFERSASTKSFIEICLREKRSYLMIDSLNIGLIGLYLKSSNQLLVFGKVFLGTKATSQLKKEIIRQVSKEKVEAVLNNILSLPSISETEFMKIMRFVYHFLEKEMLEEENFIIQKHENGFQISSYEYDEKKTTTYFFEKQLLTHIQEGNEQQLLSFLKHNYLSAAHNTSIEKRKQTFIRMCTLASQAAMNGGLQPSLAMAMEDYYMKRINHIFDINKVNQMFKEMYTDYASRVARLSTDTVENYLITRCISYIYEHLHESLDAIKISTALGVSRNYLLKKFKEEMNVSLVDFIQKAKIEEAKVLLKYSELSMIEISELLGFSSQSYFNEIFKKYEKVTPKQYRVTY